MTTPPSETDPSGTERIACDLPCISCGYNLLTLSPYAQCPECGVSICETVFALDRSSAKTPEARAGGIAGVFLTILLFIGLFVFVSGNTLSTHRGPIVQTTMSMQALMNIETEYRALTGDSWDNSANGPVTMKGFLQRVTAHPDTRILLEAQGIEYDLTTFEVLDGWGNPIRCFNGVRHDDGDTSDDYLPERVGFFFASPGRDGKWGDGSAPKGSALYKHAVDNLYSYEFE